MSQRPFVTPAALVLGDVMRDSAALGRLSERLRESKAMLATILPVLPAALASSLQSGPLDEAGWSLLCANAAVAAKVRQLVPHLEDRLRDKGHAVTVVRVRVLPK